jgi:hypothetical protein
MFTRRLSECPTKQRQTAQPLALACQGWLYTNSTAAIASCQVLRQLHLLLLLLLLQDLVAEVSRRQAGILHITVTVTAAIDFCQLLTKLHYLTLLLCRSL